MTSFDFSMKNEITAISTVFMKIVENFWIILGKFDSRQSVTKFVLRLLHVFFLKHTYFSANNGTRRVGEREKFN